MEDIIATIQELVVVYGLKAVAAIAIFVVGRWVARALRRLCRGVMEKRGVDPILTTFTASIVYFALLAFVVIAALGQLGVQTASLIALLGAAGLAIGLALQGSLANFAAGFIMIVLRPFQVGDYIEAAGTSGIVEELQIFTTQLRTPDNKVVIIPNSQVTAGNIINYSVKDTRRMDLLIGVGYADDLNKVKATLESVLASEQRLLESPAATIGVLELADNSVNLAVRPWVRTADYWGVYFDLMQAIKERFDAEGISIPYPQRDVHMYAETSQAA
ncbi:MAG: mechanosensitive ion channel family protein [Gammaproteobacteria bacterium]